jgi:hypothetical protein
MYHNGESVKRMLNRKLQCICERENRSTSTGRKGQATNFSTTGQCLDIFCNSDCTLYSTYMSCIFVCDRNSVMRMFVNKMVANVAKSLQK